jgi:hypothetical protein
MLDVLALDAAADSHGQRRRAVAELGEGIGQGFGGSHVALAAKFFADYTANRIACKRHTLPAMKKSLVEQVREFLRHEGIAEDDLVKHLNRLEPRAPTLSRQRVKYLFTAVNPKQPYYIDRLARAMRTDIDTLVAGRYVWTPKGSEPMAVADPEDEDVARVLAAMQSLPPGAYRRLLAAKVEELTAAAHEELEGYVTQRAQATADGPSRKRRAAGA